MVNEEVRRRDKGPNIIEKIQKSLRKAKKKHLVKNYEGFFKNIIVEGIPFRVRLTDLATRSVEFRDEIDPKECLGDADLEQDELEQERRENHEREGEENEGESPTIKVLVFVHFSNINIISYDFNFLQNNYEEQPEGFELNPEQTMEGVNPPEGEAHLQIHGDDYHGEGDAEYDDREEEEEEIEKEEPEILPEFPFDPSKGMSYQDFVSFYQEEIEGRLNRREVIAAKIKQNKPEEEVNQKKVTHEGEGDDEGADGEGEDSKETHHDNRRTKEEEKKMEEDNQKQKEYEEEEMMKRKKEREEFYESVKFQRYFLDEKFYRAVISKNLITKFDNNYVLAVHPEPPMQDVLMIFQHDPDNVEDDVIIYKDYGLTDRIPKIEIPEEIQNYINDQELLFRNNRSSLRCKEIDICNPLTSQEWKIWYETIVATKGHGFLQILPEGFRSNQSFKNNLLQVLPKRRKDWGNFNPTLDTMITLREEYYKKENKRVFDEKQKRKDEESKKEESLLLETEKKHLEDLAKEEDLQNEHIYKFSSKNIFRLKEYQFDHCVCILDSNPSENSLMTDFMKICEELELDKMKNLGLTVILNRRWMFVTTLKYPYTVMENGLSLFVDPFSYGGIMNIHKKQHEWPQTALIDEKNQELILQHLIHTIKVSVLGWKSKGTPNDSQFEYLQINKDEENNAANDALNTQPNQEETQENEEGEGNEKNEDGEGDKDEE